MPICARRTRGSRGDAARRRRLAACSTVGARGQDMEPRAYSSVPTGTNFLIANYTRTSGSVLLDPRCQLPTSRPRSIPGFSPMIAPSTCLVRPRPPPSPCPMMTGKSAATYSPGAARLPFRCRRSSFAAHSQFHRQSALSPGDFAQRSATTTAGASLTVVAPTGDYNPAHLVNIGSNRWAFRPDIGISQPIGNWFTDAAAGVWLFTDNHDFLQGHVSGEAPLLVAQAHVGYNFRPGLWIALDGIYLSRRQQQPRRCVRPRRAVGLAFWPDRVAPCCEWHLDEIELGHLAHCA